jgi:ketosteroid isomerase-like protein
LSASLAEIVSRGHEVFARTGEPLWADWSPDFVWDMSTFRGWPEDQQYVGREGFERFVRNWVKPFEDWQLEVDELIETGDKVVCTLRQRGIVKGSGVEVTMALANVWTFRDGKIVRVQLYADADEAFEAVGIRDRAG